MTSTHSEPRELRSLRDAISKAVSDNWGDVMPGRDAGLIHVEYQSGPQESIDQLKVWASTERGRWNLVCEYWMHEHPLGERGLRFGTGYYSAGLGESLTGIMQRQQMFAPAKAQPRGLIQVYPRGTTA